MSFYTGKAGLHTMSVCNQKPAQLAARIIGIRDPNVKFPQVALSQDTLRLSTSVNDDLALNVQECNDTKALVDQI